MDESQRAVRIPPQLAAMLARHKLNSPHVGSAAFVFATRPGRALGQRDVVRVLRQAQTRAIDAKGWPTFPILHERDATGQPVTVPQGALPSFHGFRHTAASEAIAHKNSVVTRTIDVQEIRTGRAQGEAAGEDDRPVWKRPGSARPQHSAAGCQHEGRRRPTAPRLSSTQE